MQYYIRTNNNNETMECTADVLKTVASEMSGTVKIDTNNEFLYMPQDRTQIQRRILKRRRTTYFRIILVIFTLLCRAVDGLSCSQSIITVGRRRVFRRHGMIVRQDNAFRRMMATGGDDLEEGDEPKSNEEESESESKHNLIKRITQLEELVSRQEVEIQRLKRTCDGFIEHLDAFSKVIQMLTKAGLKGDRAKSDGIEDYDENSLRKSAAKRKSSIKADSGTKKVVESFDDSIIFGTAPSSVIDAADAAGAAILAAMLGGKQRMLVDVRDAELSNDSETLVQFIELAILPIAAGLEGLKSTRNRLKIVFPKVSQLLEYRRTMALAAPEVVALSTLGFEPVEKRDKLVVLIAPAPDDEEGLSAMREMLVPTKPDTKPIQQPIVILNHHMIPIAKIPDNFETVYHLRLLSVQYMSGEDADDYFQKFQGNNQTDTEDSDDISSKSGAVRTGGDEENSNINDNDDEKEADDYVSEFDDEALEAAMQHAHEAGTNHGVTRAMVIRAYPRPWHVFVDVSPDTDASFEVAGVFDEEPTPEEINLAIVECLEGSEREDEIVAQQMQQALEEGQLDNVSNMIEEALGQYNNDDEDEESDDSDDDNDDFDMFEEDSV